MDSYTGADVPEATFLSYDESATYEEQVAALAAESSSAAANGGGLAERIGKNKVYVPPQTLYGAGKVRRSWMNESGRDSDIPRSLFAFIPSLASDNLPTTAKA